MVIVRINSRAPGVDEGPASTLGWVRWPPGGYPAPGNRLLFMEGELVVQEIKFLLRDCDDNPDFEPEIHAACQWVHPPPPSFEDAVKKISTEVEQELNHLANRMAEKDGP